MRTGRLVSVLAAVAVPAVTLSASPVLAAAPPPAQTTTLCVPGEHMTVHSLLGARFTLRNDYWLGLRPQCLTNNDHLPSFRVTQRAGFDHLGRVVAFPNVFYGCSWRVCSPGTVLPMQVTKLSRPQVTWQTKESARGRYNAAFDIWFGKTAMTTGQADGAELMIWLNTHFLPPCVGPKIWIRHGRYCVEHWVAHHKGVPVTWNYIQFRRLSRTTGVSHLRLHPFIRAAERRGWVQPTWWMENIEAGFEIWSGGQGLATTNFAAKA